MNNMVLNVEIEKERFVMTIQVKENIRPTCCAYEKTEFKPIGKTMIRMDRNESVFGLSKRVTEAINAELSNLASYPENSARALREAIAGKMKMDADRVLIGNGSYELLALIAAVYIDSGDECIVSYPSFIWYEKFTLLGNGAVVAVPLKDFKIDAEGVLRKTTLKTKIIWLVNPNNPTGTILSPKELDAFIGRVPKSALVVIDEAYAEFSKAYDMSESALLTEKYDNVIILRTFSKFYGLAALRIGYAISNVEIIHDLFQFRIPPNHNRLGAAAAKAAFGDEEFFNETKAKVIEQREYLYDRLDKLGLRYIKSEANFIFVNFGKDAKAVEKELKNRNILVKPGKEFGFEEWLRITFGVREINDRLLGNLSEIMENRRKAS
ncbi:MAG: histidinol-phosphate transaminase [Synergistaceae bacterium]|nr:histidinol-phosphate transaminase [Synergistaceae bacterium]